MTPITSNFSAAAPRLIRFREVSSRVGLGRTKIYALIKEGAFPKQRKLSTNSVAWLESEVTEWINARAA